MEATCCFHSLIIIIIIIICLILLLNRAAGFGQSEAQSSDHSSFTLRAKWVASKPANTDRREERETNERDLNGSPRTAGKSETKSSGVSFCLSVCLKRQKCVWSLIRPACFPTASPQINTGTYFGVGMEDKSELCFLENLSWTADGADISNFRKMGSERQMIDNDGGGGRRRAKSEAAIGNINEARRNHGHWWCDAPSLLCPTLMIHIIPKWHHFLLCLEQRRETWDCWPLTLRIPAPSACQRFSLSPSSDV